MYDNELFDVLDRIMEGYNTGIFEGHVAPSKEKLQVLYDDIVCVLREERDCKDVMSFDTILSNKLQPYIKEHGLDAILSAVQERFTLPIFKDFKNV